MARRNHPKPDNPATRDLPPTLEARPSRRRRNRRPFRYAYGLRPRRPRPQPPVRQFGANTADLRAIAAWLNACRVKTVALESTGVYWIPLFELLESRGLRGQPRGAGATFALRRAAQDRRARRAVDPTLALLRSLAGVVSAARFGAGPACLLAAAADAGPLRRQSCPAHAEGHGANECQTDRSRQRHHGA